VVERQPTPSEPPGWYVVLAAAEGRTLFSKRLDAACTPGAFSEAELQALYDEARGGVGT